MESITGRNHMDLARDLIFGRIPTFMERDRDILDGIDSISEILEASLVQGELAARPYADHFVLLLKAGNADGLMARLTDLWQSASDRISQNQECRILFKTGVSR